MKVLVPYKDKFENVRIVLTDGKITRDIDVLYKMPTKSPIFGDITETFPNYDSSKNYDLGTIANFGDNQYKELIAKSDSNEYWEAADLLRKEELDGVAIRYNETRKYKKGTFVFTETQDSNGNWVYNIYMTPDEGAFTTDNLQFIESIVRTDKLEGDNLKIKVGGYPPYDSNATIKKEFIFNIKITIFNKDRHTTTTSYKVPFRALVDNPTTSPLESALEWEQLPFYGQLALFDKYLNTKCVMPSFMGLSYDFTGDIDAIAVLNLQGDTAKVTWSNDVATVTEEINLKYRYVKDFYEYFYNSFKQKDNVYISKKLINIDKVNIELSGEKVSASSIFVGKEFYIGKALSGLQLRSRDFSKKTTTADGYDYLEAGKKSKTYITKIAIERDLFEETFKLLQSLSTTLALYVFDGNWIFGWYKDLYMTKENYNYNEYILEINGVV